MTDFPPPTGPPVTSSTWANPSPAFAPEREPHATLPVNAAIGAVVVLVFSLLTSKYVLDALLQFEWPVVAYVALLGLIGYGPSLAWCKYASRRWGTGKFFDDVGLQPEWSDLGWGPVVWLVAIGTQVAMGALVLAFGVPLSNNTDGISEFTADRTYIVSLVITAVIAAPFVEEIVFRGVVMRGIRSRLTAVPTVILQGVLFGVAHIDPIRGAGNIGLAVILSGVGIAFGGAAYLLRRIGPTIVAHAIFNGLVLLLVLTGIADRLQN
jgi:membrane protease YdiL (CAAX protease family)